ncbi:porin [Endozoicomonas sp. SCSIO W0465]|uniref:porin n=1 Tax=Endozoicomonas sp. SCSIO W0465 TaxID=2918516 RepID=UPI0020752CF2|nr:porin [Endozoicomonas sp. SCSIO W0465]USE38201.1 porin [Endozoicomonas sp. SCSIO W0465]
MFKKTIIASSVLAALASTTAVAEEAKADKYGHDFYGVIAVQVAHRSYENMANDDGVQVNNETRLGWRGYANFDGLPEGTKFVPDYH